MYKSGRRVALMSACSALALLASTGSAWAAKTVFVSNTAPLTEAGNDCEHPRFATIQGAVEAAVPATAIKVCPGAYSEQLVIDKPVKITAPEAGVTLTLPATIAEGTGGPCKVSPEEQTEIAICTSGAVGLTKLVIDARFPEGTCRNYLYGIFVGGGAKLTAKSDEIIGAGASPIGSLFRHRRRDRQHDTAWTGWDRRRLLDCWIHEYDGEGVAAEGAGSSVAVTKTRVEAGSPGLHNPDRRKDQRRRDGLDQGLDDRGKRQKGKGVGGQGFPCSTPLHQ